MCSRTKVEFDSRKNIEKPNRSENIEVGTELFIFNFSYKITPTPDLCFLLRKTYDVPDVDQKCTTRESRCGLTNDPGLMLSSSVIQLRGCITQ